MTLLLRRYPHYRHLLQHPSFHNKTTTTALTQKRLSHLFQQQQQQQQQQSTLQSSLPTLTTTTKPSCFRKHEGSTSEETPCFLKAYEEKVKANQLIPNPSQKSAVMSLELIARKINHFLEEKLKLDEEERGNSKNNFEFFERWRQILGGDFVGDDEVTREGKGVYLWGGVGSGKTLLLDMFYQHIGEVCDRRRRGSGVRGVRKERKHFHRFMSQIHEALHRNRYMDGGSGVDRTSVLTRIVEDLAKEVDVLYIDEFQVLDIADALIMKIVFQVLFREKVVVLFTSNRAPQELYWNGIQRELFLPFVDLVYRNCFVYRMGDEVDFRKRELEQVEKAYLLWGEGGNEVLKRRFNGMARKLEKGLGKKERFQVEVGGGRRLRFGRRLVEKNLLLANFDDLCVKPLSSLDYAIICSEVETIYLTNVPQMHVVQDRNTVARFIRFLDTAYEANVKVVVSAQVPIQNLVQGAEDDVDTEEAFAAGRAISRLIEMQSREYYERDWNPQIIKTAAQQYRAAA